MVVEFEEPGWMGVLLERQHGCDYCSAQQLELSMPLFAVFPGLGRTLSALVCRQMIPASSTAGP